MLSSNNNNPGFEGIGGFQTNGYTDISPGTSGTSSNGNYALTGSSGPMNTSSFNNVLPHSGSKMMVIDANNDIFWRQNPNIQLQGGVKYTFSYWVININKNGTSNAAFPNPVIVFNALDQCSCTPILKSGSATVNNATWQQVIYEFTPSGTGAKWVRIELSTPGATPNGNDFAIDDLSLTEPPLPLSISTSQTAISCPGLNDGSISAYGFGGVQPYSYKLTPSVGLAVSNSTGIFTNLAAGTYKIEVFDANSPMGSASKNVTINSVLDMTISGSIPANATLVPATSSQPLNTTICAGSTITLVANNMVGYTWSSTPIDPSLSVPNSASITVTPTVNTVYKVTATGPTGALGNLVYNGDFENDVAGFSSDYKYLATNPAFEKRTYGVIANPNTWGSVYDSAQDHTNPGVGKFFITDGSTSTPIIDKVWGQNIAVKPGITYDFNYFLRTITSTFPLLPAKMQLKINGVVINNTASSPTDVAPSTTAGGWVSYKHTWTAGVGVTIAVIELYDIETNGSGNDFGLDDITFIPQGAGTCTVSKEITVNVSPGTSDTSFTYPTSACQSVTTLIPTETTPATFTTGGVWSKSSAGGTLSINSSTGEINPSLSTTGIFTVKYEVLQNLSICQAASSSTFDITINPQPIAGTAGSTTVCESSSTSINLSSLITGEQPGGTWTRTTGAGGTFNAGSGTFTPAVGATTSTFTYTLIGTSPCVNSTSVATVNINPQPVAGASGNTTVCESSSASINLSSLITGEQSGGTWTRTSGAAGTFNAASSTFTPTVGATTSTFTYTLIGTSPCVNSTSVATVNINPQPVAGASGNTTVCESSSTSINLSSLITGEQSGGTWTRTSGAAGTFNAASGAFTPTVGATTSTFTYTLIGTSPCVNSTSVATVNINPQPIAGTAGNTTVCESSSTSINLSSIVTGEQSGGAWTRTTGTGGIFNAGSGTYTPAVGATTSTFTYSLTGISPCINSSSIATININAQPDAGTSGNTTVCESSSTPINLSSLITGEQSGGTWTRSTGAGGTFNAASGTFTPALGATASAFTYTLIGTSPCLNSSSVAAVNINTQPIAGTSGNVTVCESSNASINLFSLITGEQSGGIWTRTTGTGGIFNAGSGFFTPAVGATTSTFTYTLVGTSPCVNSTSVATININPQPIAGTSGNTTVCESSSTSINLFSLITGEESGGTWTRTTGTGGIFNAGSGTYTPAVGATISTFTYTLIGTSPCVNTSSLATININPQPIAGTSGNTAVCESSVISIDLFSLITGEQSGGTWTRTTGTGGTFNAASGVFTPAVGATTSTFTYTLVGTSPCVNSTSVATVNINPIPVLSINCGAPTTTSVTFNWNAISGATSYDYTYSIDSSAPISGSVSGTTLVINSLSPGQNVAITVVSVGNTCVTTANGNCVSSNCPLPTVDPVSDITTFCANGTVSVPIFTSTPVGATFNWASNNTAIGIGANGTGNILPFTAVNATAVIQTATISVTAFDGVCTGPASTFKISINPLPTVSISGTTSVCSGTGTNITFTGTPNATVTYTINSGVNQGIVLDAAGTALLPTGNLTSTASYDLVSVLNSVTNCSQTQVGNA
ncbi:beta strand repeat-containing protein, partial [Flavobacterium taihuense]|nr:hypothetical protein [Flavobacterium taihuense]